MKDFFVTYFCENPYPAFVLGVITVGFLAAAYNITRNAAFLKAAGVTILLVAGVFVLDSVVVTPREEIHAVIDEGIAALKANDADRLANILDEKKAGITRARIREGLRYGTITGAKANDIRITVNELTSPPSAKADFYGVLTFHVKTEAVPFDRYACRLTVEFEKHPRGWVIVGHQERSVIGE